jgi:Flp pilus assembly protein TadD
MRPALRTVLVLLIIAMCAPLARLAAQEDDDSPSIFLGRHRSVRYSIRGTLRDPTNARGADGVKVELREVGGPTVASVFTSGSGEFNFSDLHSGAYEIVVNETGYQPIDQQVSVEDSVLGLQILLRKLNAPSGEAAGPVVSVRELAIPRKAHELMQKGMMLLYANDYRGSITQFQRAIKEYPGYYEAYAEMGVAYIQLGDAASSEEALRKSIDVSDQHYADAYFVLANLYVNAKRFADAEPVARKGSELDDKSWKGHFQLASALYGLNRDAEAEPEAQAAAQLQPNGPEIQLLLANIHIRMRKYPAVLEDLNAYLKLDPNGANADQARHIQDQIQTALQKAQAPAQGESDSADSGSGNNSADDEVPAPQ